MRRQQKAILIGGASKSGKTLLRFILDRHSELHSFSGMNLLKHDLFRYFPEWLVGQPRDIRVAWVDIYRRMCLTRFYCFCVRGIHDITLTCPKCGHRYYPGKSFTNLWWKINRSWMRRFHEPKTTWWEKPWRRLAEKLWLTGPVQSRRLFLLQLTKGTKLRGLGFPQKSGPGLDHAQIKQHFRILDELVDAKSEEDIYGIYGHFWYEVLSEFSRAANKRFWVKESTGAISSSPILEKMFGSVKVIHMVRNGRDVAYLRARQSGQRYAEALKAWEMKIKKNERALRTLKPQSVLTVHYEDLVRKQRSTLQEVMVFLGLEFEEALLTYPVRSDQIGIHKRSSFVGSPATEDSI